MPHNFLVSLSLSVVAIAGLPNVLRAQSHLPFDPLAYPGDSLVACREAATPSPTGRIRLEYWGTDAQLQDRRVITAIFDLEGTARALDLVVPEPGTAPPRAHQVIAVFDPQEERGSHMVIESQPGRSLDETLAAAQAGARPLKAEEMARARTFAAQLWRIRCTQVGEFPGQPTTQWWQGRLARMLSPQANGRHPRRMSI